MVKLHQRIYTNAHTQTVPTVIGVYIPKETAEPTHKNNVTKYK